MVIKIEQISVPESVEGPEAERFVEYVRIRNDVEATVLGTPALAMTPLQLRPEFEDNPHRIRHLFVARVDGVAVGRAMTTVRPHDLDTGAFITADVLRPARGAGVGTALFEAATGAAHAAGCILLKVNTPHSVLAGGERIPSSTGFGHVAAADPGARFLRARGFTLEQVVRVGMLATAELGAALAGLEQVTDGLVNAGYRTHTWHGPTPAPWLEGVAHLRTRMSTDAPSGGLGSHEDSWDVERVAAHDRRIEDGGQTAITVAAEHVATGRLVGYTELYVPRDGALVIQEDTLVLTEHRGHRIGAVLKAIAGRQLVRTCPRIEQIVTYNAEENLPMLEVNSSLGFQPIGYEGMWRKRP